MSAMNEPSNPASCVLLGQVYPGHCRRSGYAVLAGAVAGARAVLFDVAAGRPWPSRLVTGFGRRLSATRWLSREGMRMEAAAFGRMIMCPSGTVFHFLYGEFGFAAAARLARLRGHACMATFHLPPTLLSEVLVRPAALSALDAVVLVGSSQRPWFAARMDDPSRIFVVPHGVDTDFFAPPERSLSETVTCLAVGSFHRNYALLADVANALAGEPRIRFEVVSPRDAARPLQGLPNVTVVEGLSDEQLLARYRRADIFVLPVRDTTANNALLEAMACGLPVIAENVGSVGDYVDAANAVLCAPHCTATMVRAIRALAANPDIRRRMGDASRQRAIGFRWSAVGERMRRVYEEVAMRRRERAARRGFLLRPASVSAAREVR